MKKNQMVYELCNNNILGMVNNGKLIHSCDAPATKCAVDGIFALLIRRIGI